MRWFVTGSHGFIGSAAMSAVKGIGYDVAVDQNDNIVSYSNLYHSINKSNCNIVLHLAAIPGVVECLKEPINCHLINTMGTCNVLAACNDANVNRVLIASSGVAEYCHHPYAVSKATNELYAQMYISCYQLSCCALRFSNVYGPGSGHKTSAIASFCKDALTTGIIKIYGNGHQTRDFIFIDDLIAGIIATSESDECGVFNIANGRQHSILEVAQIIADRTNARIMHLPARAEDLESNFMDTRRTTDALEWKAEKPLEWGILETLHWFESNDSWRPKIYKFG